ncbi:hypothetical protein QTQ03_18420 [Micromonospora sp. WMMA1363]|uniref:VHL beta domain-containing protein n=1 Tax=Micromonospora sp. WMMA1363 TaxID=3053985 RepID=UPI00259D1363|nr:hypothetical protein [Micromonospora sp. WMMA1363]MDM4721474.1 hypothetical protein [Micromonospora sp. WMMA1363]
MSTRLRSPYVFAAGSAAIVLAAMVISALQPPSAAPAESVPTVAAGVTPGAEDPPVDASPEPEVDTSPEAEPEPSLSQRPVPRLTKAAATRRPTSPSTPPRATPSAASSPPQTSPTPGGLPALPASSEASLKSVGGGTRTYVTFTNRRAEPVRVHWLDFAGKRRQYAVLEPGTSYRQQTYVGHPWVVTTNAGRGLVCFRPAATEATAVIR